MSNFFLLALHLAALCDFALSVRDKTPDAPWETVWANDTGLKWSPSVTICDKLKNCRWTGWNVLSAKGHSYVVSQASGENTLSYTFQGSAVEVFGGAFALAFPGPGVRATATVDGTPLQTSFPYTKSSTSVALFKNLTADRRHTLTFSFDSPTGEIAWVGFEYLRIQQSPSTGSPSLNPAQPAQNSPRPSAQEPRPTSMDTTGHLSPPQGNGHPSYSGASPHDAGPSTSQSITYWPSLGPSSTAGLSSATGSRHGPRPWEIAILVLGIFALLLSATVGFCLWRRRRTRTREEGVAGEKLTPVEVIPRPGSRTPENPGPTPSVSTGYAFTRPGSSVSTSRPTPWRNSRIGVSPYTYERAVPYPESTTERSSWIDPIPIPTPARRSIHAVLEVVPARHISFSGKGRILKVQNPETRSTTSVTETDTAH